MPDPRTRLHRPLGTGALAAAVAVVAALAAPAAAPAQLSFGGPTNFAVGGDPQSVAVGDFNGDADPDLAVGNTSSDTITILLGGAGGDFTVATTFNAGDFPVHVAVGDFDGDGHLDLAVANATSDSVSIFLGEGDGSFGAATDIPSDFAT
jgi:FG-GAP-like repeat